MFGATTTKSALNRSGSGEFVRMDELEEMKNRNVLVQTTYQVQHEDVEKGEMDWQLTGKTARTEVEALGPSA